MQKSPADMPWMVLLYIMNLLTVLALSLVEGITEFLPISSTGHLILTGQLLGLSQTEFVKSFEIIIQLGAISSVVVLFRQKLLSNISLWKNILTAFIPAALVGLFFYDFIKGTLLGSSTVVAYSLILGGVFMILFEKFYKPKTKDPKLTTTNYLVIGLFQAFSVIPGVSRAMATIFGGLIVGMDRKKATEFSFFLAIPTMLAASTLDIVKSASLFSSDQLLVLVLGFVGSFISALLTVKFLINFVKNHNFIGFGVYRIILGLLFLLFYL